jgi:hypothetical protein
MKKYNQFEARMALEAKIPDQQRYDLMKQVTQGEAMLPAMESSMERRKAQAMLSQQYDHLNRILGTVAGMMQYPKELSQWNDTQPLAVMIQTLPELEATQWYQSVMNKILT